MATGVSYSAGSNITHPNARDATEALFRGNAYMSRNLLIHLASGPAARDTDKKVWVVSANDTRIDAEDSGITYSHGRPIAIIVDDRRPHYGHTASYDVRTDAKFSGLYMSGFDVYSMRHVSSDATKYQLKSAARSVGYYQRRR